MTISRHLKLTLIVLIGIGMSLGLAANWAHDVIHNRAFKHLESQMEVLLRLAEVETSVLEAQNEEKAFLLRYSIDGLEMSRAHATKALKAIDRTGEAMESIVKDYAALRPEGGENFEKEIGVLLERFKLELRRVVTLAELKGDMSSGLVWEMRRMVEGLERYLEHLENTTPVTAKDRLNSIRKLKSDLLMIRRWEKDYFLRDDLVFIASVRSQVDKVEARLDPDQFSHRERGRIRTYLQTYLIYFKRIALNDVQVLEDRNLLNRVVSDLQLVVDRYGFAIRNSLMASQARVAEWENKTMGTLLTLLALVMGVAVWLAVRLTRRITGRLDTLVKAAEELGERGECATIEMDTQDEFARLADAFNSMVENLRSAQRNLVQSEKMNATGLLSASIAHEINNPLFGIQGCLERVQKRLPEDDSDRRLVGLALRESQRIARLVAGMRDYHRPSDQTMAPVDLLNLLDDVFYLNNKYMQQANVKLRSTLPATLPKVSGTRDQLQMVFVNLLTNAVEAMPGGGTLDVSAYQEKGQVCLVFTDTGTGIDPKSVSSIFEPFVSTKSEVKGVGLGLSITYGIIKRHGGTIQVESEPGRTRFTVTLPILQESDTEAPAS
ncbi:MAG: sensor histidine kinase [Leptospirillia bacterium]